MKLHVISDVHAETINWNIPRSASQGHKPWEDADLIIAAGDIHTQGRGPQYLRSTYGDLEIVLVAGNHEYYNSSIDYEDSLLHEESQKYGVHFLQCDSVTIQGTKVCGCTLWTDFELYGANRRAKAMYEVKQYLNDYHRIFTDKKKLRTITPLTTAEIHKKHRLWLHQQQADIIVTHHCPAFDCIHPDYKRDIVSSGFASKLDGLVVDSDAKYWFCGHSHVGQKLKLGETMVIQNCQGYPGEQVAGFDPQLILNL